MLLESSLQQAKNELTCVTRDFGVVHIFIVLFQFAVRLLPYFNPCSPHSSQLNDLLIESSIPWKKNVLSTNLDVNRVTLQRNLRF